MGGKRGIQITKGRLEAFSDGVFAIAATLLVLGFQPPKLSVASDATMVHALAALGPQYVVYAVSFVTIGIMWFNHYALFHHAQHVSYAALIANLGLLLFVAFLPFPTALLGQFGLLSTLVFFYSMTMLLISACYNVLYYVVKLRPDETASISGFVRARNAWNTLGPAVYLAAMVLALWSPLWGVLLIAAMAIFYILPASVGAALAGSSNTDRI